MVQLIPLQKIFVSAHRQPTWDAVVRPLGGGRVETCKGTGFFNFRILNLNNRMWTCGQYEMIVNFVGFQNFPFGVCDCVFIGRHM